MKKSVLITGGDGVLAQYVKKSLKDYIIYSPDHKDLDITNKKTIHNFFKSNKPDIVLHLAAKTNVDECEKNPEDAFLVNSEGTKNIAELSREHNSFLVYISTAAVFDGKKDIFYENDSKNPVNVYGKSKLLGENYIETTLKNFLIIRAAWLIGGGKKEKKFISYLIDQINKGEKKLKVVNDKFGTITYAKELADLIGHFLLEQENGIYHFGSRGVCSRFDIARKIVSLMSSDVALEPVSSDYFSPTFSAPRPVREVIGSRKIKFPKTWEESLEDYLKNEIIQ